MPRGRSPTQSWTSRRLRYRYVRVSHRPRGGARSLAVRASLSPWLVAVCVCVTRARWWQGWWSDDERGGRRSRPCTHTAMPIDRSACLANLHCSLPSVLGAERSIIRSLHACIPVHAWRLSANHKHRSNKRVEPAPGSSSWSLAVAEVGWETKGV